MLMDIKNPPQETKMISSHKMDILGGLCKNLLVLGLVFYFAFVFISYQHPSCRTYVFTAAPQVEETESTFSSDSDTDSNSTNLSHLVFGLVGSVNAWHGRKSYIESWWRPNVTRGFLFLDREPTADLLPWSQASPPYRVSDDLTVLLKKSDVTAQRIIHGIMEAFRGDHENMRWLVMGDDDSIFFLDNMVDVLAQYDHTKYYYIGGHSEFIMSNFWYSFNQGFGGAGFILSYPLAKALAEDMENCLLRYRQLNAADHTTMSCVSDFGVSLTALQGIHQIDIRGDLRGFLSAHPKAPLISLHHFDAVQPIFPSKDRYASTSHLMKAARVDQSRMLQQTICYHRKKNWSFSVSWGYSAQIYEDIMPRSYLQMPIETFEPWHPGPQPPRYMFNTRGVSNDSCQTPHEFFYDKIEKRKGNQILTTFTRAWKRGLPKCSHSAADSVSRILVYSPASKRLKMDRSECCDIVRVEKGTAEARIRECTTGETIA